jgi:hypothetical protein
VCHWKHVEQLRNIGIINSTRRSHLVGYFYTIYIRIHYGQNVEFERVSQGEDVFSLFFARWLLNELPYFKKLYFLPTNCVDVFYVDLEGKETGIISPIQNCSAPPKDT